MQIRHGKRMQTAYRRNACTRHCKTSSGRVVASPAGRCNLLAGGARDVWLLALRLHSVGPTGRPTWCGSVGFAVGTGRWCGEVALQHNQRHRPTPSAAFVVCKWLKCDRAGCCHTRWPYNIRYAGFCGAGARTARNMDTNVSARPRAAPRNVCNSFSVPAFGLDFAWRGMTYKPLRV